MKKSTAYFIMGIQYIMEILHLHEFIVLSINTYTAQFVENIQFINQ